jgi:hypothetical protein
MSARGNTQFGLPQALTNGQKLGVLAPWRLISRSNRHRQLATLTKAEVEQ